MSDESIRPFRVEFPQADLDDLKARLANTRWPDQLGDAGWDYGAERDYVRALCETWERDFDWRAWEAKLNAYEQGVTTIDGHPLHFLHARSKHDDAFPLLITHGWPGSILEFLDLLPMLTDPEAHGGSADQAFHVVCPSMPGYGLSGPTTDRGWDPQRIGEAEIELMKRLGYERYGAQGGDWGAIVTTQIGRLDPEHCAGIHLNMVMALPQEAAEGELTEKEQARLAYSAEFTNEGTGYQAIQGTKPQTLAYGLTDSPAGLAGWIVEKFQAWSDCKGDPETVFTRDQLLANITLYWLTGTINSSTRLYYEVRKSGRAGFTQGRVEIPVGCASFPKELYNAPRKWAEAHYNITHWSEFDSGGHFAAMEKPGLLAEDLRTFFATVR